MSAEENKAKVRRYFEDALSKGDLSVIDDLVAPNELVHPYPTDLNRGGGVEASKAFIAAMRDTFSDLRCTVDSQIAEGDLVVTRWTARGMHQRELLGLAGSGQPVMVTGIQINRFEDGKSVEVWGEWDRFGLAEQINQPLKERAVNG